MRVVVVGGTGHIGSYLVPALVDQGHDVLVLSRGSHRPYVEDASWRQVQHLTVDREAADAAGTFGDTVAQLDAEVVVDLICFSESSARQLGESLRGRVGHLLHCGSIWVHGPSAVVPTVETGTRRPLSEYGIAKTAIERYLVGPQADGDLLSTVVHPGHITGPGWVPINPAGHLDPGVFRALATGEQVVLPNLGMETLQHVHAADVAGVFLAAIANRAAAAGESFHAVAPQAITLRGYAETVAGWSGREANLGFLPWPEWEHTVSPEQARLTHDHLRHSPHCSMDKAARLLGFTPTYTIVDTLREAIEPLL